MANILIGGSLCLTDINNLAKQGHSAFTRGKNGKVYFNITEWVNDKPNDYGQDVSYQLNSHKDKREEEKATFGKCYIGNGKKLEQTGAEPIQAGEVDSEIPDDSALPF